MSIIRYKTTNMTINMEQECKDFIALVKRMREAQIEAETCMHEDYDLCVERVDKADRLEREVDELLKKIQYE